MIGQRLSRLKIMMRSTIARMPAALARPGALRFTSGFANWDFSWIKNEFPKPYAPGSADRAALQAEVDALMAAEPQEIPCVINGEEVFTGTVRQDTMPTNHKHARARRPFFPLRGTEGDATAS